MVFILVTLLLVLGIAFFHSLQGVYSALMMIVLTILSAAVAVNFYAPLSHAVWAHLPEGWMGYTDALSLAVLFFGTLVVLRTVADNVVRGNIILNVWVDRGVAGAISLPMALLVVGIGSLSFQMLPFHDQLLLFERFDNEGNRSSIFPNADGFAAWMAGALSANALSGGKEFSMLHPDWPGELSAQRIGVQHESRHVVAPDTARAVRAWRLDQPLMVKEHAYQGQGYSRRLQINVKERRPAQSGHYYLAVAMELDPKAADSDKRHRFGWGQVRLVGFPEFDDRRENPQNYYLIGFEDLDLPGDWNFMRMEVPWEVKKDEYDQEYITYRNYGVIGRLQANAPQTFRVVFEVPEGFQPWFLEYKRWARSPMPKLSEGEEAPASEAAPTEEGQAPPTDANRVARPGWRSQYQIDYDQTGPTDALPFRLTARAGAQTAGTEDAEVKQMRFSRGTVHGELGTNSPSALDATTEGRMAVVKSFFVPADKSLFRLACRLDGAQTTLLRQVFGAVQGVTQRYLVDSQGNKHLPVGQYVIYNQDGGGSYVELQYDPELAQMSSHNKPFRHVNINQLQGKDVQIGFLYLLEPGTRLERFEVGGGPVEAQNLQGLVAR